MQPPLPFRLQVRMSSPELFARRTAEQQHAGHSMGRLWQLCPGDNMYRGAVKIKVCTHCVARCVCALCQRARANYDADERCVCDGCGRRVQGRVRACMLPVQVRRILRGRRVLVPHALR